MNNPRRGKNFCNIRTLYGICISLIALPPQFYNFIPKLKNIEFKYQNYRQGLLQYKLCKNL